MNSTPATRITLAGAALLGFLTTGALAQSFSNIPGGATTFEDDLFSPGPGISVPGIGGAGVNTDAFSFGHFGVISIDMIAGVEFSVDSFAIGAAASGVLGQSASGEAFSDIFFSAVTGANVQIWDGDGVGPAPVVGGTLGIFEPATVPVGPLADDVDGWDTRSGPVVPTPGVYFSFDVATAGAAGVSAADILIPGTGAPPYSAAPVAVYAGSLLLGLTPADDVDSLVVIENDGMPGAFSPGIDAIIFTLTAGSPLIAGSGGTLFPGDLLIDPAAAVSLSLPSLGPGLPGFVAPATALGLLAGDNVDAMDINVIPEPSTLTLALLTPLPFLCRRRRRA